MGIFSPSLNSHISILLLEIMTSYHLDKSLCDIRMFPSLKRQAPWTVEILPLTHICTPQKRAFQLVCHKRVMTTPKILILFFNLFNWRLITLQYYSGFLPYIDINQPWVYMCSSSRNPPPPPPSLSHPSGSSQCTSPEHPVSCIEPGLGICSTYDNVSMLFSQIIPLSPSPTESKSLFFTSVSLLLSHI